MSPETLIKIPIEFRSDGCSRSPDSFMFIKFGWACRIHDWRYCTRSHPAGSMTPKARKFADKELRRNIGDALPWYFGWIKFVYYRAVRLFGYEHTWDSCGWQAGKFCRHGRYEPEWMIALAILEDN